MIQKLREPLSILIKYKTIDTPKIDNILKIYFFNMLSIFGVSIVLYLNDPVYGKSKFMRHSVQKVVEPLDCDVSPKCQKGQICFEIIKENS